MSLTERVIYWSGAGTLFFGLFGLISGIVALMIDDGSGIGALLTCLCLQAASAIIAMTAMLVDGIRG